MAQRENCLSWVKAKPKGANLPQPGLHNADRLVSRLTPCWQPARNRQSAWLSTAITLDLLAVFMPVCDRDAARMRAQIETILTAEQGAKMLRENEHPNLSRENKPSGGSIGMQPSTTAANHLSLLLQAHRDALL
jgi:hypothetical protein